MLYKLKSQQTLLNIIKRLKQQNKRVVFARGCFDLIHPGHIYYLKEAKKAGDILVVWLNTDKSVHSLKGKGRPVFSGSDRALILASLEPVDYICFFNDQKSLEIIKRFKPDIVAANRLSKDFRKVIQDYGGRVKIIPLLKKYSTSKIANQILNSKS